MGRQKLNAPSRALVSAVLPKMATRTSSALHLLALSVIRSRAREQVSKRASEKDLARLNNSLLTQPFLHWPAHRRRPDLTTCTLLHPSFFLFVAMALSVLSPLFALLLFFASCFLFSLHIESRRCLGVFCATLSFFPSPFLSLPLFFNPKHLLLPLRNPPHLRLRAAGQRTYRPMRLWQEAKRVVWLAIGLHLS
ncbi:hypothetical protein IWZ03DRAFT_40268 [Phyllosticta citriasiana]|uniref:Transmembrane protein n=1 Tax=Phyllosticta citriasiana TaxID=595635 RepID=A0ABR1KDK1_9PEZI